MILITDDKKYFELLPVEKGFYKGEDETDYPSLFIDNHFYAPKLLGENERIDVIFNEREREEWSRKMKVEAMDFSIKYCSVKERLLIEDVENIAKKIYTYLTT